MTRPSAASSSTSEVLDVAIVGGGLSGLVLARALHRCGGGSGSGNRSSRCHPGRGRTWTVLEASPRLGGRIESDGDGDGIDLGAAWMWPSHFQPHLTGLVRELGLGPLVPPARTDAGGARRIRGGAERIIERIAGELPAGLVRTRAPVLACHWSGDGRDGDGHVLLELGGEGGGGVVRARRVVLAAPPRILVGGRVRFDPPLSRRRVAAMETSRTWMAGVTKVALVYRRTGPAGAGAGAFSAVVPRHLRLLPPGGATPSPAFQVYDSTPEGAAIEAITFFALDRDRCGGGDDDDDLALARECSRQVDLGGSSPNTSPSRTLTDFDAHHVKRWPLEAYVSDDPAPDGIHPHPADVAALRGSDWDGRLLFAGSETDGEAPGLMEGAVGSALRAMKELGALWRAEEADGEAIGWVE